MPSNEWMIVYYYDPYKPGMKPIINSDYMQIYFHKGLVTNM